MLEFYLIRFKLMLMNPFEMFFLFGAPAFILFNIIKRMKPLIFIILYLVITLLTIPVFIMGLFYHFELIADWINRVENPSPELESMLTGDGPKMIVGTVLSVFIVPGYNFIWLLISAPILYFRYKKKGPEPAVQANAIAQ